MSTVQILGYDILETMIEKQCGNSLALTENAEDRNGLVNRLCAFYNKKDFHYPSQVLQS